MNDKEQMSLFDLTPSEVPLVELPHAEGSADASPAKKTARTAKNTSPVPSAPLPAHEQFTSLDALREAACNCQKCPLAPTRTNVVLWAQPAPPPGGVRPVVPEPLHVGSRPLP